ncbi:hypothetical protein A4X03_0g7649, partial [Tilletia caries]
TAAQYRTILSHDMDSRLVASGAQAPSIIGVPRALQDHANNLQRTYENSGKMTAGISRLGAAELSFSNTVDKHEKDMTLVRAQVQQHLTQMQLRLQQELERSKRRIAGQVHHMNQQLETEWSQCQTSMLSEVAGALDQVHQQLEHVGDSLQLDLTSTLQDVKGCAAGIKETIVATERDWMRAQGQLAMFSSWSMAWNEAVRTAQQARSSASSIDPPQYAYAGRRVTEDGGDSSTTAEIRTQ